MQYSLDPRELDQYLRHNEVTSGTHALILLYVYAIITKLIRSALHTTLNTL